jgi:hypothetical protein
VIRTVWRYVAGHWTGAHGLFWSFWVNLVLIRILVFTLQDVLSPREGEDLHGLRIPVLVFTLVFHGGLFVWQVVGVIRASESHIRARGAMSPVWGTQLALILTLLWVLIYVQKAWLMTLPIPEDIGNPRIAAREAAYTIDLTSDGQALTVTGSLELGITRALEDRLEAHPTVEQVVLDSAGGNIYAARGMSRVIREHGLNTLVMSECSSACTIAFIGGHMRQVGEGARLGFHQYRVHANYAVLGANPLAEQERDRALFLRTRVQEWFTDRMFDSPALDMWFPHASELREANVITHGGP